jgi:hypothetical protein
MVKKDGNEDAYDVDGPLKTLEEIPLAERFEDGSVSSSRVRDDTKRGEADGGRGCDMLAVDEDLHCGERRQLRKR